MQKSSLKSLVLKAIAVAALLASATSAFAQGITTSAINGVVADKLGKPVAGASITIVHEPTGTRENTTTRANGQYNLTGLRVGGPYTLTVKAQGYKDEVQHDLNLGLGDSVENNVTLGADVVQLDAFSVVAGRDTTFGSGRMGTGTSFSDKDISNTASVRNNVQDIAQLDSRLYLGSLDQGGQLSAQGQNFRYNSFLIDGVQAVDTFGLNSNGFSSLRSPIPLEAIQTLNVQLSPYDARYAGFTGALINAVTKSGTNEFHGSGKWEETTQNMRAKNPVTQLKEIFNEKTYTLTFGGPIIKDKLFFFVAYDDWKRNAAPPQANFIPDATQLATIVARAKALGYDAGALVANNLSEQKTKIGKIDYNISDQHRLSVTYRQNYSHSPSFTSYTNSTATSLSNNWYQQPYKTDSYTAQLFSNWTPDFHTEVDVSYTKFDGSPANNGAPFPQVLVNGVTGVRLDTGATIASGGVMLGTDSSRQLNAITTKESNAKFIGEYSLGDHSISFGFEDDSTKYTNAFVQYTDGYYQFANVTNWVNGGPPSAYTLAKPYPGFAISDAIARWRYDAYAMFLQDTWKPTKRLSLLMGLRFDDPYVPQKPPTAAGFATAGFTLDDGTPVTRNDTTNSGNTTWAPRVGFTYDLNTTRKTQIRGGIGLFQGKNPAVWISNAYSNAGATSTINATAAQLATMTFNADPNGQTPPSGTLPSPSINITAPNFKQPALWKSNIAIDHQLPFGGITATAEYYYNKVQDGINYEFLNYQLATSGSTLLPDGRFRYAGNITPAANFAISGITTTAQAVAAFGTGASVNASGQVVFPSTNVNGRRHNANFADVVYMMNTNKGYSDGVTLSLNRPITNHWGWSVSWTHAHGTEVSPMTSSVATSNYSARAIYNPNEDVASPSNTNITDRIVATLSREFNFFKEIKYSRTTAALVYQGRTGHNYSWVFKGDANGDGYTFNDLLYVPTGPSDPKVTWASATERDAFFAFVNSTSLSKYAGTYAPRNSETSPWIQTVDLKLTQEIPLLSSHGVRAELYMNVLNLANWFNKKWGIQEELPFSYKRAVAGATFVPTGNGGAGSWAYTYNANTLDALPVTANDTPVSRWQVLAGLRLKF